MKQLLILFSLVLLSLVSQAQTSGPTVIFRAGDPSQIDAFITSAGLPLLPSASLSITAELRVQAAGRLIASFPLQGAPDSSGAVFGVLPPTGKNTVLPSGQYVLALLFQRQHEAPFRAGIGNVLIKDEGSVFATPTLNNFNIVINQTRQVLDIRLDNSPTSQVAASYANQIRADVALIQQTIDASLVDAQAIAADRIAAQQARQLADSLAAVADSRAATAEQMRDQAQIARNQTQVLRDSSDRYRTQAATSRTNAQASENNAKGYRDATLTTYNNTTGVAAQVQNNATTVGASTTLVQALAAQVQQDRDTVAVKTTQAKQSASRASISEGNAFVSETNAGNSANQANQSKVTAGISQTAAAASAGTATTQAGIATQKAGEANVSASQSTTNLNGAITARQGAEAARDQAQVSRDSASLSRTQAATSRTNALASENAAKGYRDESQGFRNQTLACRDATLSAIQNFTINLGNVSTSATIDMSQAANTFVYGTLVGNTTLTITGVQPGRSLYLELIQGGAGGYTATFPATVRFPAGSAVDWNTTAGLYNAFSFVGRPSQGGFTLTGFYSKQ